MAKSRVIVYGIASSEVTQVLQRDFDIRAEIFYSGYLLSKHLRGIRTAPRLVVLVYTSVEQDYVVADALLWRSISSHVGTTILVVCNNAARVKEFKRSGSLVCKYGDTHALKQILTAILEEK